MARRSTGWAGRSRRANHAAQLSDNTTHVAERPKQKRAVPVRCRQQMLMAQLTAAKRNPTVTI